MFITNVNKKVKKLHFMPFNCKNKEGKEFSSRFKILMTRRNLTLKDIAKSTGNAISTVSTWKNGRIPKNIKTRFLLADTFKVSVEYLFGSIIFSNENHEEYICKTRADIVNLVEERVEKITSPDEINRICVDLQEYFSKRRVGTLS